MKTRHCFICESRRFELDVFEEPDDTRVCLEVETQQEGEDVKLPPWIDLLMEVTDDPNWTNKEIARKK